MYYCFHAYGCIFARLVQRSTWSHTCCRWRSGRATQWTRRFCTSGYRTTACGATCAGWRRRCRVRTRAPAAQAQAAASRQTARRTQSRRASWPTRWTTSGGMRSARRKGCPRGRASDTIWTSRAAASSSPLSETSEPLNDWAFEHRATSIELHYSSVFFYCTSTYRYLSSTGTQHSFPLHHSIALASHSVGFFSSSMHSLYRCRVLLSPDCSCSLFFVLRLHLFLLRALSALIYSDYDFIVILTLYYYYITLHNDSLLLNTFDLLLRRCYSSKLFYS